MYTCTVYCMYTSSSQILYCTIEVLQNCKSRVPLLYIKILRCCTQQNLRFLYFLNRGGGGGSSSQPQWRYAYDFETLLFYLPMVMNLWFKIWILLKFEVGGWFYCCCRGLIDKSHSVEILTWHIRYVMQSIKLSTKLIKLLKLYRSKAGP